MDAEARTVAFYDAHAERWVAGHTRSHAEDAYWQREIDRLGDLLPNGNILEIGSGAGRDAWELIRRGYSYTGIDPSAGLLAIARAANPTGTFFQRTATDLGFSDGSFDGCWAAASLLHLPKARLPLALAEIRRVLRPGGIFLSMLKAGAGEGEQAETGRWFAYYTPAAVADTLAAAGFTVLEQSVRSPDRDTWIVTFARS